MSDTFRFVSRGGIGDALLLTPIFRELKRRDPSCRTIVFARNGSHYEVFRRNPHIDVLRRPGWLDPRLAALRGVVGVPKSALVELHSLLPSMFYREQASRVVGSRLGLSIDDTQPVLALSPREHEEAAELLRDRAVPVAIHSSAYSSANKNWRIENWEAFVRENESRSFVQLGLASEPRVAGTSDLRGLPLRVSFAVIARSTAFVGVDSGLAHAAVALGVPSVVLFGASNPAVYGHEQSINLYSRAPCSPCFEILGSEPCPYGTPCVNDIAVAEVSAALRRLGCWSAA
ncbi:MAG: glycosyltransferase family 9 protein [Candidatus Eremiobacteraeota bacterium]|nr:glycosyltransferase family 9 protein [Candidatus Eremiobacteraeota bacterium]